MTKKLACPEATKQAGFTVVELLVVIAVIGLLVTILLPSVNAVRARAIATKSQARIFELNTGTRMYFEDHRVYPGQLAADSLKTSKFTGSQILAACLFGYDYADINLDPNNPQDQKDPNIPYQKATGKYARVLTGDLKTVKGKDYSIWDRIPGRTTAILYYPSRLGISGLEQYVEDDNAAYGTNHWFIYGDDNAAQSEFHRYIKDRRFKDHASTTPYNPDEFLLIGAGIDRYYGNILRNSDGDVLPDSQGDPRPNADDLRNF